MNRVHGFFFFLKYRVHGIRSHIYKCGLSSLLVELKNKKNKEVKMFKV